MATSTDGKDGATETTLHELRRAVPELKSSLASVMKVAAESLTYQQSLESSGQAARLPSASLDGCMEDFFSHCDQVSHLMATAYDSYIFSQSSGQYCSVHVRSPAASTGQSYSDFLVAVDQQVKTAEQLLGILDTFVADLSKPSASRTA